MNRHDKPFGSPLGPHMIAMLREKRAAGYKMNVLCDVLHQMDRFFVASGLNAPELPSGIVELWCDRKPWESAYHHSRRVGSLCQLGDYLIQQGVPVCLPERPSVRRSHYAPYVFTREQIRALLDTADHCPAHPLSPGRERFLPIVFRLLYGCGLRAGEALRLKQDDVDTNSGVLTIREAKFRKERFVPVSESLRQRLKEYMDNKPVRKNSPYLFASKSGCSYSRNSLYEAFRRILFTCNISHGGRGKGPRLHDLRHTFAVHRLENWYRQGGNLASELPVLSTYMGHTGITGTVHYLHITLALFPDITRRMEECAGTVIPGRDSR